MWIARVFIRGAHPDGARKGAQNRRAVPVREPKTAGRCKKSRIITNSILAKYWISNFFQQFSPGFPGECVFSQKIKAAFFTNFSLTADFLCIYYEKL